MCPACYRDNENHSSRPHWYKRSQSWFRGNHEKNRAALQAPTIQLYFQAHTVEAQARFTQLIQLSCRPRLQVRQGSLPRFYLRHRTRICPGGSYFCKQQLSDRTLIGWSQISSTEHSSSQYAPTNQDTSVNDSAHGSTVTSEEHVNSDLSTEKSPTKRMKTKPVA